MLRSMTGYGRGECTLHNRKLVVEIRAVNHRYNDIMIKMPRIMICFEDKLRKKLSAQIQRGKTDVFVSMETFAGDDVKLNVNMALAESYMSALNRLSDGLGLAGGVTLSMVAQFQDVVTVEKEVSGEKAMSEVWDALDSAAGQALAAFLRMREAEGQALSKDVSARLSNIRRIVVKLKSRAPFVAQEYQARLRARLDEMLGSVAMDENRLLTEVAIFADRSCVNEEITRFDSHIEQMDDILSREDCMGRKMDFLVQEMNREVNTIGSKANDVEVTRIVVDLKSELEKIREQVQNIE